MAIKYSRSRRQEKKRSFDLFSVRGARSRAIYFLNPSPRLSADQRSGIRLPENWRQRGRGRGGRTVCPLIPRRLADTAAPKRESFMRTSRWVRKYATVRGFLSPRFRDHARTPRLPRNLFLTECQKRRNRSRAAPADNHKECGIKFKQEKSSSVNSRRYSRVTCFITA